MKRILFGLLLMAAALPGWAEPREKIGVGDNVRVTVFQQPDLTTEARVSERGTIGLPLIGEVKLDGMTAQQAAAQIAGKYKEGKYLKNPQVAVGIQTVRSRQVSVLGSVVRPGRYPLEDTSFRLADVIAAAGGIAPGGSDTVTVMRAGKTQRVDLLRTPFELQSGDTVVVERSPVFYVYGEVVRAGAYPVGENTTVMQAISLSGGITPRGSERRLKLRRPAADGTFVERDATLQDRVQADDVIYVRESLF